MRQDQSIIAAATTELHPALTLAGLRQRREAILDVARRHKARNLRVVGSVARGEARPDSDVDLLVDLDRGASLLDLMGLMIDLEAVLGVPVEAGEAAALKPRARECMMSDAVEL